MFWYLDIKSRSQTGKFKTFSQIIFTTISLPSHGPSYTECKKLDFIKFLNFRIGDDLMVLLLTECSIFITIPESNNLLQISGKPLSEESVKVPTLSTSSTSVVPVYISRSKIIYGRPVCSRNLKIIGLPFKRT